MTYKLARSEEIKFNLLFILFKIFTLKTCNLPEIAIKKKKIIFIRACQGPEPYYLKAETALYTILLFSGDQEIPGLTDKTIPRRLGPKRASKIRKLFNLSKEDDVRQYVVRRPLPSKDSKKYSLPHTRRNNNNNKKIN